MGLTIVSGNEMMGEDTRRAYDETIATMRADFNPVGTIEVMLVNQMGQIAWEIKQIEAYERHITALREQEHENKIYKWWRKETNAPHQNIDDFVSKREYAIECLDYLRTIFKKKDYEPLDGRKVMWAIEDICDYQGEELYHDEHPDYADTEVYIVPFEEGTYYEKDDCEGMYQGWNVGRARTCLKKIAKYFDIAPKSLISESRKGSEWSIGRAKHASEHVDREKARLRQTKILIMDDVREELAPYRARKSNAMDRLLKLSTQLATIQAKRQGEIAANTPVVIEAAFDVMRSEETTPTSPTKSDFGSLLADIEKLGESMPKLTDILNMPNGATL